MVTFSPSNPFNQAHHLHSTKLPIILFTPANPFLIPLVSQEQAGLTTLTQGPDTLV